MFKVGERVRIVKKSSKIVSWNKDMDKTIGQFGVINSIHGDYYDIWYVVHVDSDCWGYGPESLQNERKMKLKRVLKDV